MSLPLRIDGNICGICAGVGETRINCGAMPGPRRIAGITEPSRVIAHMRFTCGIQAKRGGIAKAADDFTGPGS